MGARSRSAETAHQPNHLHRAVGQGSMMRPGPSAPGDDESEDLRQRLRQAEDRLAALSDLTSDFVYVAEVGDGAHRVRGSEWISESFENVFGCSFDALRKIPWTELVHAEDHEIARRRLAALFAGKPFDCQVRIYDLDGRMHWIRDRARPVVENGRVVRILGAAQDVTEQRRSEERLRESDARYRRLLDAAPAPIVVHADEIICFANRRAAELLGAESTDELVGQSIWVAAPEGEEDFLRSRVQRVYDKEPAAGAEIRLRRLDGSLIDVEVASRDIDLGGRPAAQVVFRDVTARKAAERRERQGEERRRRAQKLESLGSLAAGIAHDFNNMLVGVLGHADLALDLLEGDSPAALHVEELGKSAQLAADLAQQLLDYAGEKRAVAQKVDLSALCREMARLCEVSVQRKASICYDLAAELPVVEGDPSQLRQVLLNLVINAAEASEASDRAAASSPGRITVRTYAAPWAEHGFHDSFLHEAMRRARERGRGDDCRLVCLEVRDRGCGMDEETLAKLFEPFHTTKPTGRGLGMATVLGIVRAHHGAIDVESSPGEGTRIRIALPACLKV